ncbi:hypothetical protein LJB42_002440 [Komagataella kurtzmanii]|nr:hypothetical protein LJB42_002440 [Komagataella kurtzmanii]
MPDITSFPLETAPWLKDLTIGDRLAFVGDAAHPTSGAFGAGAQFGFGDVWALYRSLQETVCDAYVDTGLPADHDLHRALFLFNETRRHFLARVEKQLGYDADTYKSYISTARNDKEWRARFRQVESPLEWMRENKVEADFQRVVDEQGPFLRTTYID